MECEHGQVISPEQMKEILKKKIIQANKKYIEMIETAIVELEKIDPEDRLGYACGIMLVVHALMGSLNGWSKWCNLKTMDSLKGETLKDVFPKLRKLAIEWLKIDCDITKDKLDELEKEAKEEETTKPKKKSSDKKPTLYVA